jgi:predicted ATPase/class 3 adenylate cyclase
MVEVAATDAPVLDPHDELVGRDRELGRLSRSLADAGRGPARAVVVSGAPGVGKSALVQRFGADVVARGGIFAYGRCPDGGGPPYVAVGDALGDLVHAMLGTAPSERDRWSAELSRGLGATSASLTALVPALHAASGLGHRPSASPEWSAPDARSRLQRAAVGLTRVTASFRPVVIAVDDLHWADHDTLLLLSELVATAGRDVLLVATHRAGELGPDALTGPPARPLDGRIDHLELAGLDRAAIADLLVRRFGDGPRIGDVAAEVRRRTRGNPFHVAQLLRRAREAGVVRDDPAGGPARWDVAALLALDVPGTADGLLRDVLDQLQPDEADIVAALACLGVEFDLADAVAAVDRPAEVVADALWSALDSGLVEALDADGRRIGQVIDLVVRYRFAHDRVVEATRDRLEVSARHQVHARVGRHLLAQHGDARIFDAARHLGLGEPALDPDQRVGAAEVQRRAADLARRHASFPLALHCCETGIALLDRCRWPDPPAQAEQAERAEHAEPSEEADHPGQARHDLARELHLGAAEAAYLLGDLELMAKRLDDADRVVDSPTERARVAILRMWRHTAQHHLQDAVATALSALGELGVPLQARPGKHNVAAALVRTKLRLRRWDDERLLALPVCHDPAIVAAQRVLDHLRDVSYLAKPELFPLVVCKELELTLDHGLAPRSPVAVASYGVLLVVLGDHAGSQRFGEIALRLADLPACRTARAQTEFLHVNFIRLWRRPIREGLARLPTAYRDALDAGDPEKAGFLAAVLLYQSFWLGRPLAEIDTLAESVIPAIRAQHVPDALCRSTQQLCLNLMGRSQEPFLLAGESGYDEREVLPVARQENDSVALSAAAITKLGLHLWYGDDAGALPFAEETERLLDGMAGTSNVQLYHFANALIRMHLAPRDRSTARAVKRALALHRKWATLAPANFAAPYELLIGVWARAKGDINAAERGIQRAITLADEYQLPLVGGLACEEMAELFAATGRAPLGRMVLRAAHERWLTAGMTARSDRLERMHPWLRSRDLVDPGSGDVDAQALRHVAGAAARAATFGDLARLLLDTVAATTGATHVVLLLDTSTASGRRTDGAAERRPSGGRGDHAPPLRREPTASALAVRAVRDGDRTVVLDGPDARPGIEGGPATRPTAYLDTVVDDVLRTARPLLLGDAEHDHPGRDTYLAHHRVRSLLAVPLRLRDATIGVVCAEHDGRADAFAPAHEDAVVALCAQLAAPLRNVELEDELQAAEEQHRTLVDVQSRFIPSKLLRILDVDDLRLVRRGLRIEREMTVLISDIRGYTRLLEGMSLAEAGDLAADFLRAMEIPIVTNGGLLQDVRGDEVLALFDRPADAVRAALAMQRSLRAHNRARAMRGAPELRAGIGINVGTVVLGLVGGVNRLALTVIGDAVNLAARLESTTKRYGSSVLISDVACRHLRTGEQPGAGAPFDIRRMERVMVVNRRQPVTVYEVYDGDPEPLREAKRAAQAAFDEAFAYFDAGEIDRASVAFEQCRQLVPGDPVADLHLAHCAAIARGEMRPGQEVALTQK